ncbi:MAG: lamin tail domain-containing protein, partial [Candidatus Cloacimonetes bacterium]|nr:lamin tail domain-containing protein [Candidatus Cloacimonadota bacterium]
MKFVKWLIILAVGMFLLMGCSDDDTTGPDPTGAILVINEFLASNDFGAVDENGDHEDWIEIYNAGDEAIDIGGMYVTDNLEELMTSEIPTTDPTLTTIEPGGFLVLWA